MQLVSNFQFWAQIKSIFTQILTCDRLRAEKSRQNKSTFLSAKSSIMVLRLVYFTSQGVTRRSSKNKM